MDYLPFLYGVVIVLLGSVVGFEVRRIVYAGRAHRKLHLLMDEFVADPAHLEEWNHMAPQMRDFLPNRVVLQWADDLICDLIDDKLTHDERTAILEGLRQEDIYGRWAFARKFILHPYQ